MDDQAFTLLMSQIESLQRDVKDLTKEVKDLNHWRWSVEGARIVVVFVISLFVTKFL